MYSSSWNGRSRLFDRAGSGGRALDRIKPPTGSLAGDLIAQDRLREIWPLKTGFVSFFRPQRSHLSGPPSSGGSAHWLRRKGCFYCCRHQLKTYAAMRHLGSWEYGTEAGATGGTATHLIPAKAGIQSDQLQFPILRIERPCPELNRRRPP